MQPPEDCQQPAYHKMHLCILRHIDMAEVERLSRKPTHRCLRCDLRADSEQNLCQPKPL